MADVPTANYGWIKPDIGASDDTWGGKLNTDLDGIDSTVKSVSIVANAAYPASNPSGYQTAAQVTTAVTTYPVGDNRVINGNFAINQRGYVSGTALAAAAYGHDRWKAGAGGCTYTFAASLPDTTATITAGTLTQVIEAGMIEGGVYTLSWTGTAQARVYQGTPTGSYAASPIVTASLTAGTNTIVEFNTGTLVRAKLEVGSVATPYNRQSLSKSQADCERYFRWVPVNVAGWAGGAGNNLGVPVAWSQMRAAPTISAVSTDPNTTQSSTNNSTNGAANITAYGALEYVTAVAVGAVVLQGYRFSASAEL